MDLSSLYKIFTKDNITFGLACIGSIGTFFTAVKAIYSGRKRISVEIIDFSNPLRTVQFYLFLQNHSTNPLCISYISLKVGSSYVRCELLQKKIREKSGVLYRTPLFPLNLEANTGISLFIEFLCCLNIELVPGSTVSFEFHTNRGVIKKSLILPQQSRYLHIE